MKRWLVLLLILLPIVGHGRSNPYVLGSMSTLTCTACTSSTDSLLYTDENVGNGNSSDYNVWYASPVTVSATACATGLKFTCWDGGSGGGATFELYTDNAGSPGSRVGDGFTVTVTQANLQNANSGEDEFLFAATQNLPSGSYWVVAKHATTLNIRYDNSAPFAAGKKSSNSGSSWADYAAGFIAGIVGCNPS